MELVSSSLLLQVLDNKEREREAKSGLRRMLKISWKEKNNQRRRADESWKKTVHCEHFSKETYKIYRTYFPNACYRENCINWKIKGKRGRYRLIIFEVWMPRQRGTSKVSDFFRATENRRGGEVWLPMSATYLAHKKKKMPLENMSVHSSDMSHDCIGRWWEGARVKGSPWGNSGSWPCQEVSGNINKSLLSTGAWCHLIFSTRKGTVRLPQRRTASLGQWCKLSYSKKTKSYTQGSGKDSNRNFYWGSTT